MEDILSGLSAPRLKEAMASLKGPDLSSLLKSEWVFTFFIRFLVEGPREMGAFRSRLLTRDDITALYKELKTVVAAIGEEEKPQLARWACEACRGFFSRARSGLRVLSPKVPPSSGSRREAYALKELADKLTNYFSNALAARSVRCALLRNVFLGWAHVWYPNWCLALDGKRYGE
jgi:hypothetical protein